LVLLVYARFLAVTTTHWCLVFNEEKSLYATTLTSLLWYDITKYLSSTIYVWAWHELQAMRFVRLVSIFEEMDSLDIPRCVSEPPISPELVRRLYSHATFGRDPDKSSGVPWLLVTAHRSTLSNKVFHVGGPIEPRVRGTACLCNKLSLLWVYVRTGRVEYASSASLRVAKAAIRMFWSPILLPSLRSQNTILFALLHTQTSRLSSLRLSNFSLHSSIVLPGNLAGLGEVERHGLLRLVGSGTFSDLDIHNLRFVSTNGCDLFLHINVAWASHDGRHNMLPCQPDGYTDNR